MSLTSSYYDPFYESVFTTSDINDLMDLTFLQNSNREVATRSHKQNYGGLMEPRIDLYNNKNRNQTTVTFALPGLTRDNLDTEDSNNRLFVFGESSTLSDEESDEDGYAVRERERKYSGFFRILSLPIGVKPECVEAGLTNALTVQIPHSSISPHVEKVAIF